LSAPFLTVPLLKVPLLRLPLSEASPFSAVGLPSDFGDLCVDDLVFLTMYNGRFAIAMHTAKPAAVVILLPQLLRAYAAMFAYLHWSPAAGAGWTVFATTCLMLAYPAPARIGVPVVIKLAARSTRPQERAGWVAIIRILRDVIRAA
jgi:hypothetical protein